MSGTFRIGKVMVLLLLACAGTLLDGRVTNFTIPFQVDGISSVPYTSFGPYSTRINDGYESENIISPVIPNSYQTFRSPHHVGVQFIGDNPKKLKSDHFQLQLTGPQGVVKTGPLSYESSGFVGVPVSGTLAPGQYIVRFLTPGFQTAVSTWRIEVNPWSASQIRDLGSYLGTRLQGAYLSALNTVRSRLYESDVKWSQSLAYAAAAHARYLQRNGYHQPSFHLEQPSKPGFSGSDPWNRDMSFGWSSPLDGEVGIEWSVPVAPLTVIQNLIDTVYHRLSILSPNAVAIGTGDSTGPSGAVVMDLGFGYRSALPLAVVYPAANQQGISTGWVDIESPDPVPGGFSRQFGYPITVDFPTVQQLADVKTQLTMGHTVVPTATDLPGFHNMASNQLGIVPSSVLRPNTHYSVSVTADALFNNDHRRRVHLQWHFATGGSDQSVAVEPLSAVRLLVSVVKAGSGVPIAGEALRIYRSRPSSRAVVVGSGVTNDKGLVICRMPRALTRQIFQVVTASGNSAQFWW